MPRHKNDFLSDGSDSDGSDSGVSDGGLNSQEDDDSRAERALFEHNGRKRRRTGGGKESAWEGIFGAEDDEERRPVRGLGARRGGRGGSASRTDWTKAPSFVTKGSKQDPEPADLAVPDEPEEPGDSDQASTSNVSRPPSPRVREHDYDDEPVVSPVRVGLGGVKNGFAPSGSAADPPQAGRGGTGLSSRLAAPESSTGPTQEGGGRHVLVPTAFGRPVITAPSAPRERFRPRPTSGTATPTELTSKEAAHFRKVETSFGAKLLAGLGWAPGKGLGVNEDGRAVPIEVGKVFKGQGIQKGMRTEDSKREARRKGEIVSDEDEKPGRKERRKPTTEPDQSWKRQRKVKIKVEHKTYEQIVAEAGDSGGIGLVLDARGGELKEVASLSALSLSSWTPTSDKMQLPELRHNLRLVVDVAKGDVDALAREGKSVHERRRWSLREEEMARQKVESATRRITRLADIQAITSEIAEMAPNETALSSLGDSFRSLLNLQDEYKTLHLDEAIVGAIGQVLRPHFAEWQPFDLSSDILLSNLKQWKHAYNLSQESVAAEMTAWESLLWNIWLPKVRSAINNEWSPSHPQSAVHLLESWDPILPAFIRDNILDQLILPKIKKAVDEWDARRSKSGKSKSLAGIVFPWLPLLGERMDEVLDGAKRRIRSVMRNWLVKDGVPEELIRWRKDIFTSNEWDKLVLQYVVPKLGVCLRDDFVINPRKQDMVPLADWVMPWHTLLRSSVFSHLLEVEFFPKWLDILYIWLIQPAYKPDEVVNWFTWWKNRFPEAVLQMRGVSHGFKQGIELMHQATELGSDAPTRLKKPVFMPLPAPKSDSKPTRKPIEPAAATDITFRSLAEDFAAQNDLVFLPIGRSHLQTGKPLFKVTRGVDGKGGVTVYIGENAVFAQVEDGTFRAVSLEDMVKRAVA